jgi:hypothetical protein
VGPARHDHHPGRAAGYSLPGVSEWLRYVEAVIEGVCVCRFVLRGLPPLPGVPGWLRGLCWVSSIECVLTHNNNVSEKCQPYALDNCSNKHLFSSTEHLSSLLASEHTEVALAALYVVGLYKLELS